MMGIENKQLTDAQLQSAFVTVSGNYIRNSDFDRGIFQEDLILKTIVGADDKELTIGEARLVLVNGEQVDFDDVADSISGDVWIVASRMLNHFNLPSDNRFAIVDDFFVYGKNVTVKTRVKLFKEQVLPYLYGRGIDSVGFLNGSICYSNSELEHENLDALFEYELPMIRETVKDESWKGWVNVIDLAEAEMLD